MTDALPAQARVVLVGGGVVGCSIAYHAARRGWSDVVLLEQGELGGGTTWHAAGLVGRLRTSNAMTRINRYSAELYSRLEAETGHPTGWKEVGSLIVARTPERMTQLHRTAAMAELFGVEANVIGPDEAVAKWPLMRGDDLLGAVWLPHDGKVIPVEVARALAAGARAAGARILEGVRVLGIERERGRAAGVTTTAGRIRCEQVVLCGGMWTRQLGLECGVDLPLHPVEHHYAVSEPIEGVHDDLPVGRDPDAMIYFRSEGDAVLLGAFQKASKPWEVERVPADFSFQLLEPDWPRFQQPLESGRWRIPALADHGFARFVNGPESFTPDNEFLLGESHQVPGLFVAAGFNSAGIACAGGAGKVLADWLVDGEPTEDLWSVDPRRFTPVHNTRAFLRERVAEVLGLHYQLAWPNREFETGRGLRRSAIHGELERAGACFGSKLGWERPNWFAPPGTEPATGYSFGRQNWHEASAAEHRAAREAVAIFDQSSFAKFLFQGRDALAVLQRLCGGDVDVPTGGVVYTGMFNERGGFESDLTVARVAREEFYLVTATAQAVRDFDWIRRHVPADAHAFLTDVTGAFGVLGVMGPRSRELLGRLTEAPLDNEGFPFGTCRQIDVGPATALALRMTYVGELGWELHVPADSMRAAYGALRETGEDLGCVNAGHYAINSLRLEKAYRAWGAELSPEENPIEAGLSFAVAWDKSVSFLGREAQLEARGRQPPKRLVQLVLEDPEPMLWGREPILRNGRPVGYTTSGGYGHTLGAAVALGYVGDPGGVDAEFVRAGTYEVVVGADRLAARAHLRPAYDPDRARTLA